MKNQQEAGEAGGKQQQPTKAKAQKAAFSQLWRFR